MATSLAQTASAIRDIRLAPEGERRIAWARRHMPVVRALAEEVAADGVLRGVHVVTCAHVTTETGVLVEALLRAGAHATVCASNPLSTQDDLAAYLVAAHDASVFAIRGEAAAQTAHHQDRALDALATHSGIQIVLDDGADLVASLHGERRDLLSRVAGATEETTTGIVRLRSLHMQGKLGIPVITVNDTPTKHFFDNRYGTGQNTIDGILRATNVLLAGRRVVVCGYGWCGRGIASRARGMGAHVAVCEVQPVPALEALMDGYAVMPILEAATWGDIFVTATGNAGVLRPEHFVLMRDGAILANSGHFDIEIDVLGLHALAGAPRPGREHVEEFQLSDGRCIYLLAQGRLVGQAAAEASPAAVMDMSFANQLMSVAYLARRARENPLAPGLYPVPPEIDERIASMKLAALGVQIDTLTADQRTYMASWSVGTGAA